MGGADRPEAPGSPAPGGGRGSRSGPPPRPQAWRARWAFRATAAIYAAWLAALAVAAIVHRIS
jgi:hypothetical protein